MIDAYGKKGLIDKCEELFDKMKKQGIKPNIVTWYLFIFYKFINKWKRTTMIKVYGNQGFIEKAEELFKQMENEGIKPNVKTW